MVSLTHLTAFQKVFGGCSVFVNTNDDFEIPRTKQCKVEYQPNEFSDPVINKYQEPPKFCKIKHRTYIPAQLNFLFFIRLDFALEFT